MITRAFLGLGLLSPNSSWIDHFQRKVLNDCVPTVLVNIIIEYLYISFDTGNYRAISLDIKVPVLNRLSWNIHKQISMCTCTKGIIMRNSQDRKLTTYSWSGKKLDVWDDEIAWPPGECWFELSYIDGQIVLVDSRGLSCFDFLGKKLIRLQNKQDSYFHANQTGLFLLDTNDEIRRIDIRGNIIAKWKLWSGIIGHKFFALPNGWLCVFGTVSVFNPPRFHVPSWVISFVPNKEKQRAFMNINVPDLSIPDNIVILQDCLVIGFRKNKRKNYFEVFTFDGEFLQSGDLFAGELIFPHEDGMVAINAKWKMRVLRRKQQKV